MYNHLDVQRDMEKAHVDYTGNPFDYPMYYEIDNEVAVHVFQMGLTNGASGCLIVFTGADDTPRTIKKFFEILPTEHPRPHNHRVRLECNKWIAEQLNRLAVDPNSIKLMRSG